MNMISLVPIRKSDLGNYEKKPVLVFVNDESPEFQWCIVERSCEPVVEPNGKTVDCLIAVVIGGKVKLPIEKYADMWVAYEYNDDTKNVDVV